jgi:hypothetical protein
MPPRSLLALLLLIGLPTVALTQAASSAATRIAVFDFEFEDGSAGAAISGDDAKDHEYLKATTAEVRKVLEQSGRYALVDVSTADDEPVKARSLRNCNGCDARIALRLGARQSMIGVVRRITRTEYVVGIQLRDASTGAVLSQLETDLQMGANYSWSRGAARLVKDRLLAQ